MNDQPLAMKIAHGDEPPQIPIEWPRAAPQAAPLATPGTRSAILLRRFAVPLIVTFYTCQFLTMTISRFIRVPDESWDVVLPRLIVTLCGLTFSLVNLRIQNRIKGASIWRRARVAAVLAAIGAYVHAGANMMVFSMFLGFGNSPALIHILDYGLSGLDWLWFYFAISVMILALTYAADLTESEDRVAAFQSQAQAAQLKALRYQLNPHFLFNTLNSVAALIGKERSDDAEAMVESLSDFLRSTLTMDPAKEITLGQEIELQSLYLEIEKVRFPSRLHVTIDVPAELRDALVPNLIIQPLVENAIKYGVARSSERVDLAIVAREENGKLSLKVEDGGGNARAPVAKGTGVGLQNVSDRLRLHFGSAASLNAGPRPDGGFTARILMPLKSD